MLRVGLTGGIACGKTVIRRHFEDRGVRTRDADTLVHELLRDDAKVIDAVVERFGESVRGPAEQGIDRGALGAVVFSDAAARRELEAILHPRVFERIEAFFVEAEAAGEALAVVDAALMYETGSVERYDRVVVAYCPPEIQLERLMARDGSDREAAERRIGAQWPVERKRDRADYVVDTSGSLAETLARADAVLDALEAEAARGRD